MPTQLEAARDGIITPAMRAAAHDEQVSPEAVRAALATGRAVLPANPAHAKARPGVAGRAFRTKVNANIGRSPRSSSPDEEMCKLDVAVASGADFVMDLTVGPDVRAIRNRMLAASPLPLGTVPIYEALSRVGGDGNALTPELLMAVIREQAQDGVDFMTIHAGLLRAHVPLAARRVLGIASRGGAILASYMVHHGCENPFHERWDEILELCRRHDVTLSLGDGLRPGCLADAGDAAQYAELDELGDLVRRSRAAGVQVMVEGPGHVPFNAIQEQMEREQRVCDDAPFYVLGPVVIDIAPGYDHITSAIGATAAAFHGASLLCYVTPAEHLGLPTVEDVRAGVVAYRIAAHAADVALGRPGARDRDDAMARARVAFDWERQFALALDGETARRRHEAGRDPDADTDHCSMCGQAYCAVRTSRRLAEQLAL